MQIQANGERNITLDFNAPKKFKLLQNGVEVPYIRTGKNSIRVGRGVNGILDIEEILEKPKAIVKPVQLQPQQMALVNPADVIAINQAAQQLEVEQNILNENQKRFENTQEFLNIQQKRIDEAVVTVQGLETDNANRISATEQSIFNLAGKMAKIEEDSINSDIAVASDLEAHKTANNPHNITKETIGLNKVDNTADIDKPVSNAVKMALEEKADKDEIEQIREEIAEYQDKNEKINNALANYTGGIGGNELPIGGLTGQVLAKKSDVNGDYEWISSSVVPGDGILTIQQNGVDINTFSANTTSNKTVNIIVPTQASDINALPDSTKYGSSISLTIDNSTFVVTAQLKDQDGNNLGSAQTIDLPLESVVVNGSYDSVNKKIVLTLQNGNTIDIPVSDLISGLLKSGDNISLLTNDAGYITASSLPTVNNGQLDIQVNGTSVATFTANQSGNTTANIVVGSGLPSQTGNAGKVLGTDGTDASWEYKFINKGNYNNNVQYYPGDIVQYYYQGAYHKYLCKLPTLGFYPSDYLNDYWLDLQGYTRLKQFSGDYYLLPYTPDGWGGNAVAGVNLIVPQNQTLMANQPTVNTYSGLLKVPGGIYGYYTSAQVDTALTAKQDTLVSGTNIKTINGSSVLGSGDITISGGGIQNTATGTDSLSILGTASTYNQTVNVGVGSSNTGYNSTAVGYNTTAHEDGVAVGMNATASNYDTIAIGRDASVSGNNSIQLGYGTLTTDNIFQVWNYPLLDYSSGEIPDARISSNIARTSNIPTVDQTYDGTSSNAQSGVAIEGAISNMVTTDTAQTISGAKTFTTNPIINTRSVLWQSGTTKGTPPSATEYTAINFVESGDTSGDATERLGNLEFYVQADGSTRAVLRAYRNTAGSSAGGRIQVACATDGTVTTYAPTPPSGDNSTQIATTAWVNNNLVTAHVVIETGTSGDSWYRKYSDGWLEQGGIADFGSDARSTNATVTFPKAFSDTKYSVQFLAQRSGTSGNCAGASGCRNKATTGIYFSWYGNGSSDYMRYFNWYACGF